MTITRSCCARMRARPANSSLEYTEPVGLLGEQRISARVFGVMAVSNCSGRNLEILFYARFYNDGFSFGQFDHLGITDPIRSRNEHFITGID